MLPWDKQVYLKRLRMMRGFGFNFVRHHSYVPHDAYFEAADEVGMLVQPEASMAYVKFWPKAHGLLTREWPHIVTAYRNHPSIWAWCTGNELFLSQLPERGAGGKTVDLAKPIVSGPIRTLDVKENGVYGRAGEIPNAHVPAGPLLPRCGGGCRRKISQPDAGCRSDRARLWTVRMNWV